MSAVRRTAVAGTWYPGTPTELTTAVDRLLAAVERDTDLPPRLRAIIVPHAGLVYSGPVGAFAFAALDSTAYRSIVLVGPSHFVPFRGVSVWPDGAWDTPLGAIAVDSRLAASIKEHSPLVVERPTAHAREHSLEMQLPFLARCLPGRPIVPLVMGHQNRETAEDLGRALARAVVDAESDPAIGARDGGSVLLVASSDLSHYFDARDAQALDTVVLEHVSALDPDGLMRALEREPQHACGGGPMVAVLHAARALGSTHASVLCYRDSGDVSGDKSSVVGYMAAAIW
ncbi:MAG TPA: AmmeMemoRadiSam system protein B [Vicinamibacterales bacterium]|nr:AmmeMemoRadiSam system protein B [Vicinamibacterales bacterium]